MRTFRWRILLPIALGTLCLVALCAVTAISLFRQQATITGVLRENVSSRRAAADLRGILNILVVLESKQIDTVDDLHAKVLDQLKVIRELANTPQEQDYAQKLERGFQEYLKRWPETGDPDHNEKVLAASKFLFDHVLQICRRLEEFNDQLVEDTTVKHERVLNQLAWGMAVIGVLGAISGVVGGFGISRLLAQSIHRLRIQIQNVAGKLDPNQPEIIVTGGGGFGGVHDDLSSLTSQIEGVVQQLHEREQEVARSEQLAAVGRLAAGVGHELRNPLTSIKLLVQTSLDDRTPLTHDDLEIIESEIRRMERTLQTFLEFARPPRLERRWIALEAVLNSVMGLIRGRAAKQNIKLLFDPPRESIPVLADPEQLKQVFVNLALNALDAMPNGGCLEIRLELIEDAVTIELHDSGRGISPEMLPKLFQPFASDKETGLGLGLVICQRIVDNHGGTIRACNHPAGGASIVVQLRRNEPRG